MSLPKYEKYKDSGVQWIGAVPEHWRVDRIKASIESARNGIWGDEPLGDDGDIACVRVADFDRGRLQVKAYIPTVRSVTDKERIGRVLKKGDLLLEKSGGGELQPVGQVVLYQLDVPAVCSNFVARLVLKQGMFAHFWNYVHSAAYSIGVNVGSINQTSGIQNLDQDRYFNERGPFPPEAEQTAIATFLDHKTAKIDALIAEQEKLIALLAEKRQATISHAVTRGLNPDAPMKDSGVAWLGEVPGHWEVVPAKRVASVFVPQRNKPELNDIGDGICWATMEDVRQPRIRSTRWFVSQDAIADAGSRVLERGAVIASCVGNFGVATINEVDLVINQQLQAFIPGSSVSADFLAAVVLVSSAYFELVGTAATLVYVNQEGFENLPVPLPPLAEQTDIVKKLAVSLSEIAVLGEQAERAIDLLRERRSALIAAAVTGQIDVRGVVD